MLGVAYTPTLIVGYGGLSGEFYWYQHTNVWENERLLTFTPRDVVERLAREIAAACRDAAFTARLEKIGVKIVKDVDKSGFQAVSRPIQDKLATDLGPNAVKVLGLVRNVK